MTIDSPAASFSSINFCCRVSRPLAFGHRSLLTWLWLFANRSLKSVVFPEPGRPIRMMHSSGDPIYLKVGTRSLPAMWVRQKMAIEVNRRYHGLSVIIRRLALGVGSLSVGRWALSVGR